MSHVSILSLTYTVNSKLADEHNCLQSSPYEYMVISAKHWLHSLESSLPTQTDSPLKVSSSVHLEHFYLLIVLIHAFSL